MAYIMDHVNVLKQNGVKKCSFLVKNNSIDYVSSNMDRLNFMKMDLSNYLLTPGHVMMNYSFSSNMPFHQFKEEMKEQLLSKGCTSVLVITEVTGERDLVRKLEKTKNNLINSPIDYYIGIKTSIEKLTPSLIRACRKQKVPMLIVEIQDEKELLKLPWGWIRDAFYPYFFPIVPLWKTKEKTYLRRRKPIDLWKMIMDDNSIPTVDTCPEENMPLSKAVLKKVGIYPAKGDLRVRGEVDYNLYDLNEVSYSVEEKPLLDYHSHIPSITVHREKFLKIDSTVNFYPGFGKECKVQLPGHFVTN